MSCCYFTKLLSEKNKSVHFHRKRQHVHCCCTVTEVREADVPLCSAGVGLLEHLWITSDT